MTSNLSIHLLCASSVLSLSSSISVPARYYGGAISLDKVSINRSISPFISSCYAGFSCSLCNSVFSFALSSSLFLTSSTYANDVFTSSLVLSASSSVSILNCKFFYCAALLSSGGGFFLNSTSTNLTVYQTQFISCFCAATTAFPDRAAVSGGAFAAGAANSRLTCITAFNCTTSTGYLSGGIYSYVPSGYTNELNQSTFQRCNVRSVNLDQGSGICHNTNVTDDSSPNDWTFHFGSYCDIASIYFSSLMRCSSSYSLSPSSTCSLSQSYSVNLVNNSDTYSILYIYATCYIFYSFIFVNNSLNKIAYDGTTSLTLIGCISDKALSGSFVQGSGCSFGVSGVTAASFTSLVICQTISFTSCCLPSLALSSVALIGFALEVGF